MRRKKGDEGSDGEKERRLKRKKEYDVVLLLQSYREVSAPLGGGTTFRM